MATDRHKRRCVAGRTGAAPRTPQFRTVRAGSHEVSAQPAPVMVEDHVYGMGSAPIGALAAANGRLVFGGPDLSFSDGTPGGTAWPAACAVPIQAPFSASGLVFFSRGDYGSAYRTDGTFSAPAPPGTYGLRVVAVNACGSSAASAVQSVTVPSPPAGLR